MGKIILLGSQKGGCGKSTLAVNVAGWLVHQGHNVILVDADVLLSPSRPTNPMIKEADDTKEYLSEFPEFKVATSLVYDRKAFRDCVAEGKTVFEWKDAKAKAEINALMEEVFHG